MAGTLSDYLRREYPLEVTKNHAVEGPEPVLTLWYKDVPYAGLEFRPDYLVVHKGPRYQENWMGRVQLAYEDPAMLDQLCTVLSSIEL